MQIWVICMILYFTLPLNIEQIHPDKLALLCAGIRGIGTAGAIKFLAENNGEAFRGHRYGLTVFAISLDTPEGFLKGPVKKVLKISDPKLSEHLDML